MFQIDLLFGAILLCLQYVFMVLGIGCVIRLSNVIRKTHSLVCYNLKVNLSSQPDVNILQHRYVRAIQFFRFWLLKFTVAAHLSAHSLFLFVQIRSLIAWICLLQRMRSLFTTLCCILHSNRLHITKCVVDFFLIDDKASNQIISSDSVRSKQ